jgi:nitroimidazol reductase NimA-like FMN-containing flavoprotein (pyridoxamine 5'-phosphate oxidase superfamily)
MMQSNQMLKKEREMNKAEMEEFLYEAKVGRLGICHNNEPYIVPVLFAYDRETETIYIHCAKKGKKIDIMKTNPYVCFETDKMSTIIIDKSPCNSSLTYRSVIAFGVVTFINDPKVKAQVLNMLIRKYANETKIEFVIPEMTENTQVIIVKIVSKTGKQNKKA